jgi:hypothetical protein
MSSVGLSVFLLSSKPKKTWDRWAQASFQLFCSHPGWLTLRLSKCFVFYLVTRRTWLSYLSVISLFRVGILLGSLLLFVWLLLLPLLGFVLYYYSLCPVAICLIKWRVLLLFWPCVICLCGFSSTWMLDEGIWNLSIVLLRMKRCDFVTSVVLRS